MFVIHRKENSIKLKPESVEDLWHLEKIIKEGDRVRSLTERKREEKSGTFREKMKLTLKVEKREFHKDYGALKILGKIVEGPEDKVSLNTHHSFKIYERDVLTIAKDEWKKHELDRLKEAKEEAKQPKITVAIMDERKAEVYTVMTYGLEKKASVKLPGKGKYADVSNKDEKYDELTEALESIDTDKYILAGPGFESKNYMDYLKEGSGDLPGELIHIKTNDSGKKGVYELMKEKRIDNILKKSRLNKETQAINELMKQISKSSGKATYGLGEVEKAVEYGAVDRLIVTESKLFEEEEKINDLMAKTEKKRGSVVVISEENEEKDKIESLGGIGAILRYEID